MTALKDTMNCFQQQVITAAQQGSLVLTANKRLFRVLREGYDQQMLRQGHSAWPSPQIHPYEGWLKQCLQWIGEGGRLLSAGQQRYLWEEQIAGTSGGSVVELMNLDKTTDAAVRAHNLLAEYGLSLDNCPLNEDQQMFALWRQGYLQRCRKQQWLDQGGLIHRIISAFVDGQLALPEHLLLVGFDQLPAGVQALTQQLRALGVTCQDTDASSGDAGQVVRFDANDEQHETEMMARWVRFHLQQGATSIGIVVPDLEPRRQQIERVLQQQLDPQASANPVAGESSFNLSLGASLASQGVIDSALSLLEDHQRLSLDQVSSLLRCPFIVGSISEADRRALFDQRLRSLRQDNFRLSGLLPLAEAFGSLPLLQQVLTALAGRHRQALSPEQWATTFDDELKGVGWPADAHLTSTSYQAVEAWYDKVLTGLASLDPLSSSISRQQALRIVQRLARELEFQPESPVTSVQVVGLLESSGLFFDHLWVMGLSEGVIPARPRPNPFIPYPLQEQWRMPHASFNRELEFAEQVVSRLHHAAANIVFSYPRRSGDCELNPSRLIARMGGAGQPQSSPPQDLLTRIQETQVQLESWSDSRGPVLEISDSVGGTALLKDQAHCPFRAFVHHRLRVKAFDQASPGLSPGVRGDLVHLCLQSVWRELKHHSTLIQMSALQRHGLIENHVSSCMNSYFEHRPAPSAPLLLLEQQRIIQLLEEWFDDVEIPRQGFAVMATEQEQQVQIGPLSLKLVVDRIDCLDEGGYLIIDYKTGAQIRIADFLTEPLLEPQLPSYAVAGGEPFAQQIKGVVIAKVRRGDCRLLGIVSDQGLLGKVKDIAALTQANDAQITTWDDLLHFWQRQLEQLAGDFSAGMAAVTPYDTAISCRFCDLPGLCRIGAAEPGHGADHEC